MVNFLIIVHIILAVMLIIAVLLQPSSGDNSFTSSISSSPDQMFKQVSIVSIITKATYIIVFCFILNSITLALVFNNQKGINTILDDSFKETNEQKLDNKQIKPKKNVPISE